MTDDLFALMNAPPMTTAERRRKNRRTNPRGYVRPPGTGPEGETCGSCEHHTVLQYARSYHKCELAWRAWTHGPGTDIRVRSPACEKWELAK